MLKVFLFLILSTTFSQAQGAIREVYIPSLECQEHYFQDVSITFDDEKTKREELTISLICQRLKSRLVQKTVVQDLSRFVIDKLAPQQVEKFGPRANDFFKLILFKPDVIGKKTFEYTEDELEQIIEKLKRPKYMRLRTFSPSPEHHHVLAFHSEGAAYLNRLKTNRDPCSMINTLVHEYMHFVGYGHGDNSPEGKMNSVPYFFGERAQELCEAGVI